MSSAIVSFLIRFDENDFMRRNKRTLLFLCEVSKVPFHKHIEIYHRIKLTQNFVKGRTQFLFLVK